MNTNAVVISGIPSPNGDLVHTKSEVNHHFANKMLLNFNTPRGECISLGLFYIENII